MSIPNIQLSIHGVGIQVSSASPFLLGPVTRFLRYFPRVISREEEEQVIEISLVAVAQRTDIPPVLSSHSGKVSSQSGQTLGDRKREIWQCDVYVEPNKLIADFHAQGLVAIDFEQASAQAYLIEPEAMHEDVRISYFHFALIELLKRRGLYTLHATALEKDGQGILIPGCSGRGKTTAFVSLLRSGFRCVSDDHPLLHERGGELELLAFEEKVDITENSLKFFPELQQGDPAKLHQGIQKRYFYIEDFYKDGLAEVCRPRILLFPQVVDVPASRIEPLSKARALEELLPETMTVHDKVQAKREFQFLSRMVRQLDCYLLYFGNNVPDLPHLVLPLLKA